ncbi:hypothetical protein ACH41E_04285 [Streptomyces sp. NPDC020412]|uniref:hypothetical protein n=1 Tax=Streptomyces sp. NPDC020412 TaxID=3365073 RepID=UPI0037A048A2
MLLDGSMTERQRGKQRWPPFGMPKGVVLLATPEGWRYSVLTVDGGMLCGRLADLPIDAGPAEARAAAAAMVAGRAPGFDEADIDVTWDPPGDIGTP